MTNEELAYIAGFFDGEGSVTINPNNTAARGKSPNHIVQVSLGNTDDTVVNWLQDEFGGYLTYRYPGGKRRSVTQWTISANKAMAFLEAIYPYLRMKQKQAEIAINFQRHRKRNFGGRGVPPEEIAWRNSQREAIRLLNGRWHGQYGFAAKPC